MRGRKPDIHDRNVGRVAPHLKHQVIGGVATSHDVELRGPKQARDPLAEQNAVLGNHGAHGISARIRVPPPIGLQIRRRPSSASTRSATPRNPPPRSVSAPPIPSSVTSMSTRLFERLTSTVADEACAYLPTLVSVSHTR